jgi:dolichyl-diphosphooligosaccharide--protein glycosyltransferase
MASTSTSASTSTITSTSSSPGVAMQVLQGLYLIGCLQVLWIASKAAYEIRLYAINEYGRVIHEFDPYFNYRATEYLWQHGAKKFFQWFDYQSWYPLGRSVGTTIYPGMQFTSVWIKQFLLPNWSINDICCFLPAWFGVLATLSTSGLAYVTVISIKKSKKHSFLQDIPFVSMLYDAVVVPTVQICVQFLDKSTGSTWGIPTSGHRNPPALESAVFTACIMSIVPAHLLRSVGGGYDNESVATTAMQITFLMWTVTCYAPERFSIALGVTTGIAYFYMVAAWGGYIFVINLVGIHALFLLVFQKLPWTKLYKSYTSFYVVGTFLAMQVPVVNWAPLRSLEQLGPCGVFLGMQVLQLMCVLERRYPRVNRWRVRGLVIALCLVLAGPIVFFLYGQGYFGPLSSRVRGLFVAHTKTGNPLVDSVAEHQAASPEAYYKYLYEVATIAPFGLAIVVLYACTPSSSFLILYGAVAYFFSHKMVRLIILTAPIASVLGGIFLGYLWAWMVGAIFGDDRPSLEGLFMGDDEEEEPPMIEAKLEPAVPKKKGGKGKKKQPTVKASANDDTPIPDENQEPPEKKSDPLWVRAIRLGVSVWIIRQMIPTAEEFHSQAHAMAQGISHPTIISKARLNTGEEVLIDDYRQAYLWLRDNTPEDARIMAWWDYGYQITGIANRTTIADGNTWNHEHIALLGRIFTSPEKEGHRITRHLADYVLVWAGGGGDDLAKSPHLIRIANSVYRGMCQEPTCRTFGMMVRLLVFRCDLYSNFFLTSLHFYNLFHSKEDPHNQKVNPHLNSQRVCSTSFIATRWPQAWKQIVIGRSYYNEGGLMIRLGAHNFVKLTPTFCLCVVSRKFTIANTARFVFSRCSRSRRSPSSGWRTTVSVMLQDRGIVEDSILPLCRRSSKTRWTLGN